MKRLSTTLTFVVCVPALGVADGAVAADCPRWDDTLAQFEDAVLEAELDEADRLLKKLNLASSCDKQLSQEDIAQSWIAEAMLWKLKVDEGAMDEVLVAAKVIAPDYWNAKLGNQLKERQQGLQPPGGDPAELKLVPTPVAPWTFLVNGEEAANPVQVDPGLYLLQVADDKGAGWGRTVYAGPGEELVLEVELKERVVNTPTPAPTVALPEPVQPANGPPQSVKKPLPKWLIVSGGAAVGAGVFAGLASSQNGAMRNAEDVQGVDQAFARQKTMGTVSYGLAGIAAVGLGLHFTD